jgi:hypothetical protein
MPYLLLGSKRRCRLPEWQQSRCRAVQKTKDFDVTDLVHRPWLHLLLLGSKQTYHGNSANYNQTKTRRLITEDETSSDVCTREINDSSVFDARRCRPFEDGSPRRTSARCARVPSVYDWVMWWEISTTKSYYRGTVLWYRMNKAMPYHTVCSS